MGYKVNYNPDHPGTNCVEASRFAMALLMPKDLIEKWMKENKGSTDDEEYIKMMAEDYLYQKLYDAIQYFGETDEYNSSLDKKTLMAEMVKKGNSIAKKLGYTVDFKEVI